jgi:hypothetical protein
MRIADCGLRTGWRVLRHSAFRIPHSAFILVLLLAGCSRSGERAGTPTAAPTPTLAAISPTASGILNPPQTARPTAENITRQQAEAVLARSAVQVSDLPPAFAAAATSDQRSNDPRLLISQTTTFAAAPPWSSSGGTVSRVTHIGAVFSDVAGAQSFVRSEPSQAAAPGDPRPERIDAPQVGDERQAWRVRGPGSDVAAMLVVRRGPVVFIITTEGTGDAPETLAADLARRLDQRTAAALR